MDAKLQKGLASLDAMKANSTAKACDQLDDFIDKVRGKSGRAITVAQSDQLIAAAIQVRLVLGCF